jgi:hypothetical protein
VVDLRVCPSLICPRDVAGDIVACPKQFHINARFS